MHSRVTMVRRGDQVSLVTANAGRALFWLVWLEISLLGLLLWKLSAVLSAAELLVIPAIASVALIAWTAFHVRPDYRVDVDLAAGTGHIVRISPVSGATTTARFTVDDLESIALHQAENSDQQRSSRLAEYVVAVDLRDGARHVLTPRGPLLAYRREVDRFRSALGLGARAIR